MTRSVTITLRSRLWRRPLQQGLRPPGFSGVNSEQHLTFLGAQAGNFISFFLSFFQPRQSLLVLGMPLSFLGGLAPAPVTKGACAGLCFTCGVPVFKQLNLCRQRWGERKETWKGAGGCSKEGQSSVVLERCQGKREEHELDSGAQESD